MVTLALEGIQYLVRALWNTLTKGATACHTLTCWVLTQPRGSESCHYKALAWEKEHSLCFGMSHPSDREHKYSQAHRTVQVNVGFDNVGHQGCHSFDTAPPSPLPTLPFETAARPLLLFLHNVSIITCQASAYRPGMVNKRSLCLKNVASFTINLVLQMHTIRAIDTEANTHINM